MSQRSTIYFSDGNLKRRLIADPSEGFFGGFTIHTAQDCEPIVEENKRLRELQTGKESFVLLGRMPVAEYERAVREGWIDDPKMVAAWLNDSDNRAFRVKLGRA